MPSSCHKRCRDRSPPCGYRRLHPSGRTSPYSFQRTPPTNDVKDEVEEIRRPIGRRLSNSAISTITFAMASRCLFEKMKKRTEVLGVRHPATLNAMVGLAQAYYRQLRYRDAEKLGTQVLDLRRDVFGDRSPGTIEAMADLARVRWRLGQIKEVAGLEMQIVRLRREVEGEKEMRTIRAMVDLAETWRRLNQHDKAAELFETVLRLDGEVRGEKRWLTLQATERLGWTYQQLGRFAEAMPLQTRAFKMIDDALLGKFADPDPISADGHSVPQMYYWHKQGRYPVAEPYARADLHKTPIDERHPDMLWLRASLAWEACVWQGRHEEAELLLEQALEPQERVFGERHPDTMRFKMYLTTTWRKQGRQVEAEAVQSRVLELQKEVLGPRHPDTILSMAKLADNWHEQGRFMESALLQSQTLELYRTSLGIHHYDTQRSMNSLARAYHSQGWLTEAEAMYAQVLAIRKVSLEGCPPQVANSMVRLAIIWQNQGRRVDAEKLISEAIAKRKALSGDSHPNTLRMEETLGTWRRERRKESLRWYSSILLVVFLICVVGHLALPTLLN